MPELATLHEAFAGARPDALVMAAVLLLGLLVLAINLIVGASLGVAHRAGADDEDDASRAGDRR